jgi:hypothetical protein
MMRPCRRRRDREADRERQRSNHSVSHVHLLSLYRRWWPTQLTNEFGAAAPATKIA